MTDSDDHKEFSEYRSYLVDLGRTQSASFDKTLLVLSTGALGVSILFVDAFAVEPATSPMDALVLSWIMFVLTMVLNLFSYLTSWLDTRVEIKFIDANHDADWRAEHENFPRFATGTLNLFASISFVVGVIAMLYFVNGTLRGQV